MFQSRTEKKTFCVRFCLSLLVYAVEKEEPEVMLARRSQRIEIRQNCFNSSHLFTKTCKQSLNRKESILKSVTLKEIKANKYRAQAIFQKFQKREKRGAEPVKMKRKQEREIQAFFTRRKINISQLCFMILGVILI